VLPTLLELVLKLLDVEGVKVGIGCVQMGEHVQSKLQKEVGKIITDVIAVERANFIVVGCLDSDNHIAVRLLCGFPCLNATSSIVAIMNVRPCLINNFPPHFRKSLRRVLVGCKRVQTASILFKCNC
jgi:hypothetical protein